ncbi:chemotaxis protein [bacteria symbiont BFo1 of Frankliniella occidentalis]|uniref:Methyl-accepting chemotaxis protein n=1 Tax=Erwinia aphidicola TaxID=68334 RepID=A0ABU8DAJ7_ERWAP|nr:MULTISPECIES: methyl-accepting chemotaxis protein [Erwinia]KMV69686.1 chemotaxis protein [bacteria symbiont BFo1 of Frankliniella occidentalis]PIJ54980.1 chemotaxis protein [Erwinia sp. OLMDLW33]KYP83823.1 chemotaxis protein [bacteria symbiont BFo1 of Frankliniella occidentalis]KYP89201.1 chemotaxis protein [bacteria symbiont BFo1 of Frankliniella occidentalis]MBD1376564.1 methyl-accepting chemotaxis protein [Erwinia aphidicola]
MQSQTVAKKRMSTRTLMLLTGVLTITLGFSLTIGLLSWQSSQQQKKLAEDYLGQIAQSQALSVQKELEYARTVAAAMGQSLIALPAAGITDRAQAEQIMVYALKMNPSYLSMSAVLEPNVLDGRDAEFASQPGSPPGGRFSRYVDRDKAGAYQSHLMGTFLTPGDGDYYLVPRKLERDTLAEPYSFAYEGVPTLLTSVSAVIFDDGKVKAVTTSDISLASLQEKVSKIKPWQGAGYAMLLSTAGKVVSSPNKDDAGKPYKGETDKFSSQIIQRYDPVLGEDVLQTWRPITVGNSQASWYLGVAAPVKLVMAAANRQLMYALIMAVISIVVVCGVLGLVFSRKVAKPIGGEPRQAADIALAVAEGDLSATIPVKENDKQSIFFAMQTMQHQLRNMVGEIISASDSVRQGAEEIASGNLDLASRTEQQAAALEETAASMEQLTATVKHNADNAHQATALTDNATDIARRGEQLVSQVVQIMQQIDESSQKIGAITSIINGIAFQTNILALNAAVEAARAGEQGRGFAVVAAEVRSLAQRSANAVKDISALIAESTQRVDHGVDLVQSAGKTMQEMTQAVNSVKTIIGEIVHASDEQSQGIGQVTVAVNQMDGATQQNSALVQQMSAAAASLEDQAKTLAQTVQLFKLETA